MMACATKVTMVNRRNGQGQMWSSIASVGVVVLLLVLGACASGDDEATGPDAGSPPVLEDASDDKSEVLAAELSELHDVDFGDDVSLDELLVLERDRIAQLLRQDHPETFSYVSVEGEVLEIGMVGGHLPIDDLAELTSYSPVKVVESSFSSQQLDGWAEALLDQLGEADRPASVGVIAHHTRGTIELLTPEPDHPGLAAAVDAVDGLPPDIVEIVDAHGSVHPYLDPGSAD
jgi:hypothetical protein